MHAHTHTHTHTCTHTFTAGVNVIKVSRCYDDGMVKGEKKEGGGKGWGVYLEVNCKRGRHDVTVTFAVHDGHRIGGIFVLLVPL